MSNRKLVTPRRYGDAILVSEYALHSCSTEKKSKPDIYQIRRSNETGWSIIVGDVLFMVGGKTSAGEMGEVEAVDLSGRNRNCTLNAHLWFSIADHAMAVLNRVRSVSCRIHANQLICRLSNMSLVATENCLISDLPCILRWLWPT